MEKSISPLAYQHNFNHMSPQDLEEILEYLEDEELLSVKGKEFRAKFWEMFVKE